MKKILLNHKFLKNTPRFSKKYNGFPKIYFLIEKEMLSHQEHFEIQTAKELIYADRSFVPKNTPLPFEVKMRKNNLEIIVDLLYNKKAPIYEHDLEFFCYIKK